MRSYPTTIMQLSYSYSPRQAVWLNLDPKQSFLELLDLPITHLRLCTYWPDIQQSATEFNFDELTWYLQQCERKNKKVSLAIGLKTPRWPEFQYPNWTASSIVSIEEPLLVYLKKLVNSVRDFSCIESWQIENEPFDPSGPQNSLLPQSLYDREIQLVRSLDSRKIIGTVWGNDLLLRGALKQIEPLIDEIGLDFYPMQSTALPKPLPQYRGIIGGIALIKSHLSKLSKPFFISELQAEPWESDAEKFLDKNPKSFNQKTLKKNLEWATQITDNLISLWGIEYWLFARKKYAVDYFKLVTDLQ
jgi:hypothetical protein